MRRGCAELAARLAVEFRAPIGLLDPVAGAWCALVGADAERFPRPDGDLLATLTAKGFGPGRAVVWRSEHESQSDSGPDFDSRPLWLALPVARPRGGGLIALAGFAASVADASASTWGPVCPPPALRAWGQSVADQLRGEVATQTLAGGSPAWRGERAAVDCPLDPPAQDFRPA